MLTYFHQEFDVLSRLKVSFGDTTPPIYIANLHGERWVDTMLLPATSTVFKDAAGLHKLMLSQFLDRMGISREQAFDDPTMCETCFTYRFRWLSGQNNTAAIVVVGCGGRAYQLALPDISSVQVVNCVVAEAEVLLREHAAAT